MFKHFTEMKVSAGVCCILLLLFSGMLFSQEQRSVDKQEARNGIRLEYKGSELAAGSNYLAIADSGKNSPVLLSITLDGNTIWLARSRETVNREGVVHWYDDQNSGIMTLDLGGIRSRISPESDLQIVLSLIQADDAKHRISAYQSGSRPGNQTAGLRKIKDLNIEIN